MEVTGSPLVPEVGLGFISELAVEYLTSIGHGLLMYCIATYRLKLRTLAFSLLSITWVINASIYSFHQIFVLHKD